MPYFYNHKLKSAGTPVQPEFGAIYPFGFGLTYTSFEYGRLSVERSSVPVDGEIGVSCTVKNTGKREGDEVVQLYVHDLYASLVRPVKELKGYKRITLRPEETKRVRFVLPVDMLGFTTFGTERVVEPGDFDLMIGSSSDDIRRTARITVTGAPRTLPEDRRMLCEAYTDSE
jgi:beta-glucosidase